MIVRRQFPARAVEERQHRLGVLLQVMDLVLNPRAVHLERKDLARLCLELEIIEVLDDFELAGQDARQVDRLRLRDRVIGWRFHDDGIIDDQKLADGRYAQ